MVFLHQSVYGTGDASPRPLPDDEPEARHLGAF